MLISGVIPHILSVPTSHDATVRRDIEAAFAKEFPPLQHRILEIVPGSLHLEPPHAGTRAFVLKAHKSAGGIAGPVDLGIVTFTGTYNERTHAVRFREVPERG